MILKLVTIVVIHSPIRFLISDLDFLHTLAYQIASALLDRIAKRILTRSQQICLNAESPKCVVSITLGQPIGKYIFFIRKNLYHVLTLHI